MLIKIHLENPEERKIREVSSILLRKNGVVVLPTDSIYLLATMLGSKAGYNRICQIKKLAEEQPVDLVCIDLSSISKYAKNISNQCFKLLRKALPGPYKFLFAATKEVPKYLLTKKGFIGIRMPNNKITLEVIQNLATPLVSTSVTLYDNWFTDPEDINDELSNRVDAVVDGGIFPVIPPTVIDCTTGEPIIFRKGMGDTEIF
jgi:tRNA threonylcarbamoyl adenosine modification protein (Sua5/YciO/YrdC/YwlC family)